MRCVHGVDDRVGVCADCVPDQDDLSFRSFAPRREPFVPAPDALAQAGRDAAGAETAVGEVVATVTVRFRQGRVPLVSCGGPTGRREEVALSGLIGPPSPGGGPVLAPMRWAFDPAAVQGAVRAGWAMLLGREDRQARGVARRAEKARVWAAERPFRCRWCDLPEHRWRSKGARTRAERTCNGNPDQWFPESWRQPPGKGWRHPAPTAPTIWRLGQPSNWQLWVLLSPGEQAKARVMAGQWRAERARLFDQDDRP